MVEIDQGVYCYLSLGLLILLLFDKLIGVVSFELVFFNIQESDVKYL